MRFESLCLVLWLGGCDATFRLGRVTLSDAAVDAAVDVARVGACPASFGESRYRYIDAPLAWLPAEEHCRLLDDEPGDEFFTHLAVTTTFVEISQLPLPASSLVWVGLADLDPPIIDPPTSYEYVWITEETPATMPWGPGQPDSMSTYRVGQVLESGGSLWDAHHATALPFVCECDEWPVVLDRFQ